MKRSRIVLLAFIVLISILLSVIFRKKIENFVSEDTSKKAILSLPPATNVTLQPEIPQPSILPATAQVTQSTNYVLLENTISSKKIIPASYISPL